LATKAALKYSDIVVTEAGFGSDLGAQKFLDIKVPLLKKNPDCVVIVTTIQAIVYHGANTSNPMQDGLKNLAHHIKLIQDRNLPFVIALNVFDTDLQENIDLVANWAKQNNYPLAKCESYSLGNIGSINLAKEVISLFGETPKRVSIYEEDDLIEDKIIKIAKNVYGASSVVFMPKAKNSLLKLKNFNYPICIAKTPLSLSNDPKLINVPTNFTIEISDIYVNNGSRLIVALTKGINTLPGLGENSRFKNMRFDSDGGIHL